MLEVRVLAEEEKGELGELDSISWRNLPSPRREGDGSWLEGEKGEKERALEVVGIQILLSVRSPRM